MGSKTIKNISLEQTTPLGTDWYEIQQDDGTSKKVQHSTITNNILAAAGLGTEVIKDIDYQILDDDGYSAIFLSGAGAAKTFTLPTLADNQGREITLYNDDTTYGLTVDGEGAETISGMTTIVLPKQYNFIKIKAYSTEWKILAESITSQLRLNTYAGYGSTDTKIMRFTNVVENVGNMFSENHVSGYNGNAKGLEITIQRSGFYSINYTASTSATSSFVGLSLNSSQLTTQIQSITISDILSSIYCGGNFSAQINSQQYFKKGDVIRPHTYGLVPVNIVIFSCSYSGQQ